MPDAPTPPVPQGLQRAAVDRVLARALELQASTSGDSDGQLSEVQLMALAKEVGLDPVNLRQALAEERTRVALPPEGGMLARLYGASTASAQRTVHGTPPQVLKALDDWMQRQECLAPQRYFAAERIVWEAQRGVMSALRRTVTGKGFALTRASDVSATAIAVDGARVVVRLDARLEGYRTLMAQEVTALGAAGVLVGGVVAVLSFPVFAIAAPVAVLVPVGFAATRASHQRTMQRAQIALEQVLDRLERGEAGRAPSLLSMLAAAAGHRR